jgi:dTMP kinase
MYDVPLAKLQTMAGKFIVFEGIEGGGKSTQLRILAKKLEAAGVNVCMTREPGGNAIGEAIREIVLNKHEYNIYPESELLLMFAARFQHIHEIILPALQKQQCVLCDRFLDSSYAYQVAARGVDDCLFQALVAQLPASLQIHKVLMFDLSVATSMQRLQKRKSLDRIERQSATFFSTVRNAYLARAKLQPKQYAIIDAELPLDIVELAVCHALF